MLHDLLFRLRTLFRRRAAESELDDELRFHLEKQVAKHVNSGMSEAEALRCARLELGGLDQVKETSAATPGASALSRRCYRIFGTPLELYDTRPRLRLARC